MRIIGHGIDLVEIERISRMIDHHGERFLKRCFTELERSYVEGRRERRDEHFAGRFAVKEAVLKVLGTGYSSGVTWCDIEVAREPSGRPVLRVSGRCGELASHAGISRWLVSISHIRTHALASVIGVAEGIDFPARAIQP